GTWPWAWSGCWAAGCMTTTRAVDSTTATAVEHRDRSSAGTRSASRSQSCHAVASRASQVVPWPGSLAAATLCPRSWSHSASGRIDAGHPVNPCCRRKPSESPSNRNASAPARTRGPVPLTARSSPARVAEELDEHVEAEDAGRSDQHDERGEERPLE